MISSISSKLYSGSSLGVARYHFLTAGNKLLSYLGVESGNCSRGIEYSWVLKNLEPGRGRVLDIGCSRSFFSHILVSRGYDTYGIDTSPYYGKHPKMEFNQGDVTNTPFADEFFDAIVAVSTVEHIGVGYYGDPRYEDGDFAAIREMARILKKNGRILVTSPYCRDYLLTESERIYDEIRLDKIAHLVDRLSLEKEEYYTYSGRGRWIKSSKEEARDAPSSSPQAQTRTTVCLALVKKRS